MNPTQRGRMGESCARAHLEAMGMTFVAANVRNAEGEIDLIMRDGDAMVFVEVKLRRTAARAALEAVDRAKRVRISNAAVLFAMENGMDMPMRFDVVGVVAQGEAMHVHHARDAFAYCGKYFM